MIPKYQIQMESFFWFSKTSCFNGDFALSFWQGHHSPSILSPQKQRWFNRSFWMRCTLEWKAANFIKDTGKPHGWTAAGFFKKNNNEFKSRKQQLKVFLCKYAGWFQAIRVIHDSSVSLSTFRFQKLNDDLLQPTSARQVGILWTRSRLPPALQLKSACPLEGGRAKEAHEEVMKPIVFFGIC